VLRSGVVCAFDRVARIALASVAPVGACGGTSGLDLASRGMPPQGAVEAGAVGPGFEPAVVEQDAGAVAAQPGDEVSEGSTECDGDWILSDSMGFVSASTNASGITGLWTMHTDCDDYARLEAGAPVPGMNCSLVTVPASGMTFAPDPTTSAICTTGSTVQVFSDDEWTTRWGAYVALDLKQVGDAAVDFNAQAAGLRGFCLYLSGATVPIFRVRLASDQGFPEQNPYGETLQHEGWHRVLFSELAQVEPTSVPFDPTRLLSIEVEIPASQLESIPWDFCIEGLVALR
jgi:hypothetical protein